MNKEITLTPNGGRFNWIEHRVTQFSRWRNNVKYRIYLGCDPVVWHTLKGDLK